MYLAHHELESVNMIIINITESQQSLELPAAGNRPRAEDAAIFASLMATTLGWFTSALDIKVTLLVK